MARSTSRRLLLIGGGEDKQGEALLLRHLVAISRNAKARIVVITTASEIPEEVGDIYQKVFKRLGVEQLKILHLQSRDEAQNPSTLELMEKATAVFFTGGDQFRITSFLGGTPLDNLLHRRVEDGLIVAGTSAGAAMMSQSMIVSGIGGTNPRRGVVQLGPGMEFLPGAVVDTHFSQRGRLGRLITAVAQYPHELGIGIDDDTAIDVAGDQLTVLGSGAVTVVDLSQASHIHMPAPHENENLALNGVQLHILAEGYRFHLKERKPMPPGTMVKAPGNAKKKRKS